MSTEENKVWWLSAPFVYGMARLHLFREVDLSKSNEADVKSWVF